MKIPEYLGCSHPPATAPLPGLLYEPSVCCHGTSSWRSHTLIYESWISNVWQSDVWPSDVGYRVEYRVVFHVKHGKREYHGTQPAGLPHPSFVASERPK